jgi:uncharacterized protein
VSASIYISTDVPDTDITVKLLDVDPSGRALNLSEGIARAQYRESFTDPTPLKPGQVYKLDVELYPVSNWFAAGHRVRVEVSSSNFPTFPRNLNTGDSDTGTQMRVAHTKIFYSARRPSAIVLPVVPEGASAQWRPPVKLAEQ